MRADHLLSNLYIAVTRPIDQAESLNFAIAHHGGTAISVPLLAISALDDYQSFQQQLTHIDTTDWAIFISSNAVEYAMPLLIKKFGKIPDHLKFAAIGHQTAKALALYGAHEVLVPHTRFDSETLLAVPEMQDVATKTIAIFRGVGGRELMADTLKASGANVYFAESYRRINPQKNADLLAMQWRQNKLDAIIVTSSEAMRNLLKMSKNAEWLRHVTLCVNHERIAEEPQQLGLKVLVAKAPGDEAMLQCLSQLVKHHD
jgi:uroporphyrinogen-III synthase